MQTYMQKVEGLNRNWHVIDVQGKVLGDVASEIATLLIGKNKPTYTPHVDGGDYVVVINATLVHVTGRKTSDKMYYRHSGFPGGITAESFETLMARDPKQIIERAVKGMLPKNKQQTPRLRRLKVFPTAEHTYNDKFPAKKSE